MGADLIILDKNGNRVAYFNDNYNSYNLLWQLKGSYWEMAQKCKTDKERINYLSECLNNVKLDNWKEWFKNDIYNHFTQKLRELNKWINIAEDELKNGGEIIWSV